MSPISFQELIGRKQPVTKDVEIPLDPELADELATARAARDDAARAAVVREKDTDAQIELLQAEEKVSALEQRMRDENAVAYFKIRSIGRAAFDALVDAHPPTSAQRAKAKSLGLGELLWNHETFPPALVAASVISIELPNGEAQLPTEDEIRALWANPSFNPAELDALANAALEVNGTRRVAELGKGSVKTPSSGRS